MAVGNAAKEGFARRNGTNYTVGPTYAVMCKYIIIYILNKYVSVIA